MNDKRSRSLAGEDAIAKLKLELYEAIETKMNASLERDRQFIQGTIAAASKIGGYVVSIVALAITLFGVKTCSDVKSTVETTTKNEIDEQLKKSNPVLAYEKETKRYLEGALVNYYRIMLAAPEQDNRTRLPLPSDLVRMQTILRSPEADDTLFSQIIDILVSISDREEQSKLGSALTELLAAKLPSLSWIERSVAKRVSIVDALARLRYGDARSVIVPFIDHADELKLRVAAIKFAAKVNAADAATTLSKLANDPERDIKNTALGALVIIDPTNNTLAQTLQSVAADRNAQAETIPNAFSAFSLLDTKSSKFFVSEQEGEKNNQIARLLSQLLEACAEHDVLISLSLTGDTEKANGETKIHFVNRTRDGISYWIYSSALVWNDAAAVNLYLKTALSQPNLSLVAKKLSIFPDKSEDAFSTPYQLVADLTEQSSIETTTGQTVTGAEAPYGLVFTQVGAQSLDDVVITWLDGSGIRRTSHVTKINNPEKVTFNWKRPRDPFR